MAEQSSTLSPFATYEEMLNDKDCKQMINWIMEKYSRYLDYNDIKSYSMQASWNAWLNYDPNRGAKFTTYLFNRVDSKLRAILYSSKEKYKKVKGVDKVYEKNKEKKYREKEKNISFLSEILGSLNQDDRSLLEDKYIKNMNSVEIAKNRNVSPRVIRERLKTALERCRNCVYITKE